MNLEQLLRTVEHAGRDSRRQQQLMELIKTLDAEETAIRSRKLRRVWTITISAAACMALFVTTIVKLIGEESVTVDGPLTAEVNNEAFQPAFETVDSRKTIVPIPVTRAVRKQIVTGDEDLPEQFKLLDEVPSTEKEIEEYETVPEKEMIELFAENDKPGYDDNNIEGESMYEQMAQLSEPEANTNNSTDPVKEHRHWLKLRRAEPSKMDGTMLAFNLF